VGTDPNNPKHFSGFWCLRHQVSTVFDPAASPEDFVVEYDNKGFHMLAGGDRDELAKARRALKGSRPERILFARLHRRYGRPATSSNKLAELWGVKEKQLGLLYFFGHADARTMGFSPTDVMSIGDFKKALAKSNPSPRCLVFLNGCYTTNPDPNGTFFEATGRDGFCGYIGAETEVPATFAFRFGLAFQYLLFQGLEVVEVMARLRVQHWPLSLVYGLYGFPHLRVEPVPALATAVLPNVNYSAGPLGELIA
jgi:hypothetical protein